MPSVKIPSLPPDVEWLLNLTPTQAGWCDSYIDPPNPLPSVTYSDAPDPVAAVAKIGARSQHFVVANVFASDTDAHWMQRQYDLCSDLANKQDDQLKTFIPGLRRAYGSSVSVVDHLARYGYGTGDAEAKISHANEVMSVCYKLASLWERAFEFYDSYDQYGQDNRPTQLDVAHRLCLVPRITPPPSRDLVATYKQSHDDARQLILLTARHELGHLHELVKKACTDTDHPRLASYTPPDGWGLNEQCVGLLRARARGDRRRVLGVPSYSTDFDDTTPVRRTDTPLDIFDSSSHLAGLYHCFEAWYDHVHRIITNRMPCGLTGCSAFIPPGRTTYCCNEHATEGRKANNTENKRERRKGEREAKAKQQNAEREDVRRLKRTARSTS